MVPSRLSSVSVTEILQICTLVQQLICTTTGKTLLLSHEYINLKFNTAMVYTVLSFKHKKTVACKQFFFYKNEYLNFDLKHVEILNCRMQSYY